MFIIFRSGVGNAGFSTEVSSVPTAGVCMLINEHAFDSNHPISDDSFKILSNSTVFDLKVLETLYIHKLQPNLNYYNSSLDLHIVK